jgi:hypothetical protein
MFRRMVVTLCVLAFVSPLAGCVNSVQPAQTTKARSALPVPLPASEVASADARFVAQQLDDSSSGIETTLLPSLTAARRAFPGALAPTETLGWRLVGIVLRKQAAVSVKPRTTLSLVYEHGLVVSQTSNWQRPRHPIMPNPTRESTTVAGVPADVEFVSGIFPRPTVVSWVVGGDRYYTVEGHDLTKAAAVRIARSLAP